MRILVCDDDEALISMIRFKITRDNMGEVVKAMDGREAMKLIKNYEIVMMAARGHQQLRSSFLNIAVCHRNNQQDCYKPERSCKQVF